MIEFGNDLLKLEISKAGAELCSVVNKKTGQEYMWTADKQFWARHAPILFPIVGSVWNGEYHSDSKTYKLGQHGFARDSEFEYLGTEGNKATFKLASNEKTKGLFPYDFILKVVYELTGNVIRIHWIVENPTNGTIYFQVGAHPGFNYVDFHPEDKVKGYFKMNTNELKYKLIGSKGCLNVEKEYVLKAEDGFYPITADMFDHDALVVEEGQITSISLCDKQKKPYITMNFDAPVTGLWSPTKKNAPFVCIEPWYGRCDRENFTDDFSKKDHVNKLEAGKTFHTSYTIEIDA